MQMKDCNRQAAVYLRLSSADGADSESNSIQNQRSFLTRWAKENEFTIVREFVDDGCTGTDFNRIGFQQLNESIMSGETRCLIVKDLSRLGRNYAETGRYMEQIFPRMGVRFIAVNDGYDSAQNTDSTQQMAVFRNVFNDFYAADCSIKVRTSLKILKKQGKYLGGAAPYGYRLDPADKYHLLPDPETAPVVQRIFRLFLAGYNRTQIAGELTRQGIPSPVRQKAIQASQRNLTGLWSTNTLRRILSSRVYAGDMEQQLTRTVSYKVHIRKKLPEEEHVLVENTHQPLVSREDFRLAQTLLQTRSYQSESHEHLLTGLAFCRDCGAPMYAKRRGNYWYLNCYSYYRSPGSQRCTSHSIREDAAIEAILEVLRQKAETINITSLIQERDSWKAYSDDAETRQKKIDKRLQSIRNALLNVYRDRGEGLLNEEQFRHLTKNLQQEEALLLAERERLQVETAHHSGGIEEKVRHFLEFRQLTKSQLALLVRRVEIGQNREIDLYLAFR